MSRKNQPKDKRLDNLVVLPSSDVWVQVGVKPNGQPDMQLKPGLKLFGKVRKGTTAYVSTNNRKGEKHKFVDDFSALNKNTKQEICDMLENQNKRVAYIVEKSSIQQSTMTQLPKATKKAVSSTSANKKTTKKGVNKK